jgi:anti-sigma regulatory factor (Ser/Thr protein kinase)
MCDLQEVVDVRLPAQLASVASVRRAVAEAADHAHFNSQAKQVAVLLASEIATNAVTHTDSTTLDVRIECDGRDLLVQIDDGDRRIPARRTGTAGLAESGRGLEIVDQLSSSWGTRRTKAGKSVWFRLSA